MTMEETGLIRYNAPEDGLPLSITEPIVVPSLDLYAGLSVRPFTAQQAEALTKNVDPADLDILPTGEVYLSQIHYRKRLNAAFGPGGWGMRPLGNLIVVGKTIMREYALYALGRFIAQSMGEADYHESNERMSYASAAEGCKSNALTRCCKDLGIAWECWDAHYTAKFKREYCVQVKRREQRNPWWWRRLDEERWYDEVAVGGEQAPKRSTPAKPTPDAVTEPLEREPGDDQPAQSGESQTPGKAQSQTSFWALAAQVFPGDRKAANEWVRQRFGHPFPELDAAEMAKAAYALHIWHESGGENDGASEAESVDPAAALGLS